MKLNPQNFSFTPDEPWFSQHLGTLTTPYEWLNTGERREKGFGGPDLKRSVPGRSRKLTPAFKMFDYMRGEHGADHNGSPTPPAYLQEVQKIKEGIEEDLRSTRLELSTALDE